MKIASYNIRGLGSSGKKDDIRGVVRLLKLDFCSIQEKKLEVISELTCKKIWGGRNFEFAYRNSIGRSGGILSIWNSDYFCCSYHWSVNGVVVIMGKWIPDNASVCFANVYGPIPSSDKEELWDKLLLIANQNADTCLCILGDFKAVRDPNERSGQGDQLSNRDIKKFDEFVRHSLLLEVPLLGRKFTWYQPDGKCKSKLDHILVNEEWISRWSHSTAKGDKLRLLYK